MSAVFPRKQALKRPKLFSRKTDGQFVRSLRPLCLENDAQLVHELLRIPDKDPRVELLHRETERDVRYGVCMHRSSHGEDRVIEHQLKSANSKNIRVFGVVDGHGGTDCASYVCNELPVTIENLAKHHGCLSTPSLLCESWGAVLESAFDRVSAQWDNLGIRSSGAVASLVLVSDRSCLIAHAGDCKIVASLEDESHVELTRDHRCSDPDEAERVEGAGGVVVNGRVEGRLLPSRAFGDIDVRTVAGGKVLNCIAPEPDISFHQFDPKADAFMVLASDGLFDVIPSHRVVSIARKSLRETGDPDAAAKTLTTLASQRSTDDVSVIVLYFKAN